MSTDSEILAEISDLIALEERREGSSDESEDSPSKRRKPRAIRDFKAMPLSLIVPAGHNKGVAYDAKKNIVGLKIGLLGFRVAHVLPIVCKLRHLQRLVFFCRGPFDVPTEIQNLKKLKLLWLGNALRTFPKELLNFNLPLLVQPSEVVSSPERSGEMLLKVVSEPAQRFLTQLREEASGDDYAVSETKVIERGLLTTEVEIELAKLEGIFLDVVELEDPPLEIAMRGRDAIARYFQQRSQGDLPLNELKVILVGNGGSGKTSLVKRIVGEDFDPEEAQTHGINIRQWDIQTPTRRVKLHFWDFGGQEIMHATHQFFLSKRSIYILVLDGRKDEDPEYWLQHIQSFGGDSPIMLVLNRVDEHPAFDVNRRFLKSKYRGIVGFFRISCAKAIGLEEFVSQLASELDVVPMLQTRWPQSWFKIKQRLDDLEEPFLSLQQYQALCLRETIVDEQNQELLVDFLNDLGVVLHFKDMELLDTHVLDPRWVTDGVYRIINSETVAKKKGLLPVAQIGKVLSPDGKYPKDKHLFIINLMLKFELCYKIEEKAILIPDLLDIQEPSLDFDSSDALFFVFEYGYLPKSVMPRFIVRMHADIDRDMRWRTGVVLFDRGLQSQALIRADEKAKRIYVAVRGEQKRDYFAVIKKAITEINLSFEKIQVTELVPLPDVPNVFIDYAELRGYEIAKRDEFFVGRLGRGYNVKSLLNGIEEPSTREAQVILVQGDYYASASTTSISTHVTQSGQVIVNNEGQQAMGYNAKNWEKAVVYSSAVAFLGLVGFLLIRNQPIADPNLAIAIRTIISLIVSLFGATIPGMLHVDFSARGLTVRALGALALFVLTFVFTPTVIR